MNAITSTSLGALLSIAVAVPFAFADSPKSLTQPDAHSIEAKGTITLYRVQVLGQGLGSGKERLDAELFVTLDSDPGTVFSLPIKDNSPRVNTVIADTLREAFVNKTPVILYHQIAPGGKRTGQILMVQLSH